MNIGRAKTILIYAFLGLNLFLCYHLFFGDAQKSAWVAVSPGELRRVEKRMEESGYALETKIDCAVRKSSFLTVAPSLEMEQLLRKFFAAAAAPAAGPEATRLYTGEGATIAVYPGGAISIEFAPGREFLKEGALPEEKELASAFERYLESCGLTFPAARFDHMSQRDDRTILHYLQIHEGRPLYSGYLKAVLVNNTLLALDIYWLDPEDSHQEREMEVIPATEALLRLIEVLGPSRHIRRIIKADLGYYSLEYDAEEWEVPPVWRFLFDDGESYFINAFTGNPE